MSGIVRNTQQVSIVIAAGSTSNTATINTVNTSYAVLDYGGVTGALTGTVTADSCCASIVITNGTTITATRNTSDASNSLTVNASIIELSPNAVKTIQTGTATMTASTSQTATVTSVTTTNSAVLSNGWTTTFTTNGANAYSPTITLTNATTVTIARGTGTNNLTHSFIVLEFNSSILNSSTQQGTVAFAAGDTSKTATITSVTTGQAMIVWNGFSPTSLNNSSNFFPWLTLTNGTTVTGARTTGTSIATNVNFAILEFKAADIKTLNRGSVVIAASTSSKTATITAVNTALCIANFLGHTNGTAAQTNFAAGAAVIELTNTTTVTGTRGTAANTSTETVGYETIEFTAVTTFHDAWADPDDVYPFRREEERYVYPSFSGEALLKSTNFNTIFEAAWSEPDDVFAYRKPDNRWTRVSPIFQNEPGSVKILYADAWEVNDFVRYYQRPYNAWVNVKPVYEANPATIKIFYADAWEIFNQVRYYPEPNWWWTELPEKYEANPAQIGIFYTDAWVPAPQARYYPARNYWWSMLPELFQSEPGSLGIVFSDAWSSHFFMASQERHNFHFLNTNPIITASGGIVFDEFIIRARRRGRR